MKTMTETSVETISPQLPEIKTTETIYDVIKRNRQQFITALRENKDKQIVGKVSDHMGSFCFVGLGQFIADQNKM